MQDAKSRYSKSLEDKEKLRREKMELAEKRQREIYLNGGYVDCVNSGCRGQGTSDTSYLCKNCFTEQLRGKVEEQEPSHQMDEPDGSCMAAGQQLTVKLPSASSEVPHPSSMKITPCKGIRCEFYGSPEFDSYCSKCYSTVVKARNEATSR